MTTFKVTRKIRFGQTDAAGITFYPRLVEMINDIVEDFFEQEVRYSYKEMIVETDFGVPTVNLNVTFKRPAELEDKVGWYLNVLRIGNSSFTVDIKAKVADAELLTAEVTLAYVKGKGTVMSSHPLPEKVKAVLKEYIIKEV
jgi:4-hydroxybenzoyl-CoA thioesterase